MNAHPSEPKAHAPLAQMRSPALRAGSLAQDEQGVVHVEQVESVLWMRRVKGQSALVIIERSEFNNSPIPSKVKY